MMKAKAALRRGAMTPGCSLWMPIWAVCEQNKAAPPGAGAPADSPLPVDKPENPECSDCACFIPESAVCKQRGGQVFSDGWCAQWVAKG